VGKPNGLIAKDLWKTAKSIFGKGSVFDPSLQAVMNAWPVLPEAIRKAILALLGAGR
jgi:hypothetical protein